MTVEIELCVVYQHSRKYENQGVAVTGLLTWGEAAERMEELKKSTDARLSIVHIKLNGTEY